MSTEQIIILTESVILAVLAIIIAIIAVKSAKKKKGKANNTYVKNGVRYTHNEEIGTADDVKITHAPEDIILELGTTYVVCKEGKIIPGKYTMLATSETVDKFNVRLGDFVREYAHATDVVLSEGETICPVSHDVILR